MKYITLLKNKKLTIKVVEKPLNQVNRQESSILETPILVEKQVSASSLKLSSESEKQDRAIEIDQKSEHVVSSSKYLLVEITRQTGIVEKFTSNDTGFAKREGDENVLEPKELLDNLVIKEKRSFYKNLLQHKFNDIENIVILSGAGSSVGIGVKNKGQTMVGLWNLMESEKPEVLKFLITETKYHDLDEQKNIVQEGLIKDLETLLSNAGRKNIVSPSDKLTEVIKLTREFIAEKCTLTLPHNAPHIHFLNKVLLRPQKFPRVKIFTLNYDTLFEQAAALEKFTVIDGFTFSNPRIFNGKYFDYDIIETRHNRQDKKDSTIAKLFYLFKMHGSLNWRKKDSESEVDQFDGDIKVDERVMIFPQDSKYEHSYEQPYFEMMARFQQALRTENTLLITIGFSFFDKHISSVILESIKQNPSLNLIALTYPAVVNGEADAKEYQKELHRITEIQSRVTLVAENFEDFAKEYPENLAHRRFDLLEELNKNLKALSSDEHN
jgi:NAD-dependent SIR2 family protein deacetylase